MVQNIESHSFNVMFSFISILFTPGEEVFGFWRLNWMGQIRLRYFMSLSRQPSDYNPWTNMLEKVATLVKEGGDGMDCRSFY